MGEKWITFDLDGTLMQNPFVGWVFPEIEALLQEKISKDLAVQKALVQEHQKRMNENRIYEAYDWDGIVKDLCDQHGVPIDIQIEELVKGHSVEEKVYLLEPEILKALQTLKEEGYKLAAVTNGYSKYQLPVMEFLKLNTVFDQVITPEEVGYAKPQNEILAGLMEQGEIAAHVGDRIDHDVCVANQNSIPSIFIYRKLPETLKGKSPFERIQEDECKKLCEEKWRKETKLEVPITTDLFPSIVIHSISDELVGCIRQLNSMS
ncbi:HAD family hydrolase [Falsibacillus pallidus]|uniref:HAD superfamily hydrolase (TIGR01549 family) n=1 Tax=Falsibacillus pallidus TaxID=493781 RepID=A0A370G0P0_9BACI|nr:HAD family hydrolase [Falsibacillus pallidus]RDI36469.1 HAD superfamily hydrolase (TIGR01549 family) [Falsibacillus pallidus]